MGDLALMPNTEPAARVAELARIANEQGNIVLLRGEQMLEAAILCGHALLEAQRLVGWGSWEPWLDEHFSQSRVTAAVYMRCATYEEIVRSSGVTSIAAARRLLAAMAEETGERRPNAAQAELAAKAKELKAQGLTHREVASMLDVPVEQITYWTNPDAYRKRIASNRRRKQRADAARRALARQTRDEAIRKIKGPSSEAYSLLRKAAQALDHAQAEADTPEVRAAMLTALGKVHDAEDELVTALGIERGVSARAIYKGGAGA